MSDGVIVPTVDLQMEKWRVVEMEVSHVCSDLRDMNELGVLLDYMNAFRRGNCEHHSFWRRIG